MRVHHPVNLQPINPQSASLHGAQDHYPPSDLPLFTAAYNELCRVDLNGKRVLEVCCGFGKLAACLSAAYPQADLVAVDRYPESGKHIKEAMPSQPHLSYQCGDALHLPQFADETFDLIYGQATLHHLAHDVKKVGSEYSRLLKPGGRLIFVFEPLGHNPVVAAIRAIRFAKTEGGDESNLYFSQFKEIAQYFEEAEVQAFNLLGYPMKALKSDRSQFLARLVHKWDDSLLKNEKRLKHCANCNVIFRKKTF